MVHLNCYTHASSCEDPRYRADAILFRTDAYICRFRHTRLSFVMPRCSGRGSRKPKRVEYPYGFSCCGKDIRKCDEEVGNIDTGYAAKLLMLLDEVCLLELPRPPACLYDRSPDCVTDEPTRCPCKVFERFAYDPSNPGSQRPWERCLLPVGHEGRHDAGCIEWNDLYDMRKVFDQ